MRTHGLGGDSRVRNDDRSVGAVLHIGPRKVIPLCQLALDEPELLRAMLDEQLAAFMPGDLDGVALVVEHRERRLAQLEGAELELLHAMGGRVAVASRVLGSLQQRRVMERLVQRGVLQIAAFTPTDAAHVLGMQSTYDIAVARRAADLFARSRDRQGKYIAESGEAAARATIDALVRRSAEVVLAAAFEHDGLSPDAVRSPVVQAALDRRLSATAVSVSLTSPLVGLGASAPTYYPLVADLLGSVSSIPEHADVANAVGAVVGRVRITRECVVTSPVHGQYLVHAGESPAVFTDATAAREHARSHVRASLEADMVAAGASEYELDERWDEKVVDLGGAEMFVEGLLAITASGRPEVAARH
jgi:N-methylhydantoinase A/oxoprolinase/acetone carboxylase beta subunit